MTRSGNYTLRIDLEKFDGEAKFAEYSQFSIDDAADNYTLHFDEYLDSSTVRKLVLTYSKR